MARKGDLYVAARNAMEPLKPGGVRGLIWPASRKIAAPVLQVQFGGDKSIPQLFAPRFWSHHVLKNEKPILISTTRDEWKRLSDLWAQEAERVKPRRELADERPQRFGNRPFEKLRGK